MAPAATTAAARASRAQVKVKEREQTPPGRRPRRQDPPAPKRERPQRSEYDRPRRTASARVSPYAAGTAAVDISDWGIAGLGREGRAGAPAKPAERRTAPSRSKGHKGHRQRPIGSLRRRVSGPLGGAAAIPAAIPGFGLPLRGRETPASDRNRTTARRRRLRFRLDARLLDRIVRGRVWIPLLALLLVGIVAMRVEVLKLGAKVGTATQLAAQLQSTNQTLRENLSSLSNPQRIEDLATSYGMTMPGPMDDHFVSASSSLKKAIASISAPQPQTFLTNLQAEKTANGDTAAAIASGAGLSTTTATTGTGTGGTGSTGTPTGSTGGSASSGQTATGTAGAGTGAATATGASGTTTLGATSPSTAAGTGSTISDPTGTGSGAAGTSSSAPAYGSSSGGASIGG